MQLYPLKFQPKYKYRIWGGEKLRTSLNKKYSGENIGESWEISDVENDETTVSNGELTGHTLKQLILIYKEQFLGSKVYKTFGEEFPLLIKFIDAKTPLSIQVHPGDKIAKERHNSFGKNEMWYVMDADKDAELIVGFEHEIDKNTYQKHLQDGTILDTLHHEKVKKGDTFYIPTGRIHAIGAGVLLAEIQQTSDVTYRIFDYNRVEAATGKTRELHNNLALDVIDFNVYENYKTDYSFMENEPNKLVHSPYFKTNILNISGNIKKDFTKIDSFVIYICVDGKAELKFKNQTYNLEMGETILIPACINEIEINSEKSKLLEVYM